ncbi:MAG: helix-turn-helix domain-containing protein [Flavobacteriaceae bacterium]|nr:helix-turn-helix domain-containing protein [Flavobacteriaceae bacterium]
MINNTEFALRLKKIMDFYQLSASAFADKINVQRSSISHLLSGRNKPSLDFVLKTVNEFDRVELYWLLNGKGVFPKDKNSPPSPISSLSNFSENIDTQENKTKQNLELNTQTSSSNSKSIERIVIFYKDGTFKEYIK